MKNLFLEKKTGFSTLLPFQIYEYDNNNLFYSSDYVDKIETGQRLYFNLPLGKYKYNGFFQKLEKPIVYKKIILPPKEREIEFRKYKIIFDVNPNKCTIYYDRALIVFDNAFKNAPIYIKYDIYFHEIGHHFYSSEKLADLYAIKRMLDLGFNPSQIGRTKLFTLSEGQYDRKQFTIDKLTNEI